MNIKGKITMVKEVESITTRDKRLILKRTAVIETEGGKYAQSIAFDVMGEDVNNHVTEFNGKLYNNIRAWRIKLIENE